MVLEEDVIVEHQRPLQQYAKHWSVSYADKPAKQMAANSLAQS